MGLRIVLAQTHEFRSLFGMLQLLKQAIMATANENDRSTLAQLLEVLVVGMDVEALDSKGMYRRKHTHGGILL